MARPTPTFLTRDWADFDPASYLREYYEDIGSENLALLRFLIEAYQALPPGGSMLDFGGGPTIYPLISAVGRVEEFHFSDYLEGNLDEVRRWVAGDPSAFDWSEFIKRAIELETGTPCSEADVGRRSEQMRALVTRVMRCDASRAAPLDGPDRQYDVVVTNFCAESATSDREEWRAFVTKIASLLQPGGTLIMSALKGASRYAVGPRWFPSVDISEEELLELLEDTGFTEKEIELRSIAADRPTREYAGLILVVARKQTEPDGSTG